MITTQDLTRILYSSKFQDDLAELSLYAASMKQERPIVLLLAKYLWRKGHKVAPELKKCDLDVDGVLIEFKFHYDADVSGVCGEMQRLNVTLETLPQAIKDKILHPTWTATPGIYKDIVEKKAGIFIWIICARDLSSLNGEDLKRVCISGYQEDFRKNFPYPSGEEIIEQAQNFLGELTINRPCLFETLTIKTNVNAIVENGEFPSTYHFIICEFSHVRSLKC